MVDPRAADALNAANASQSSAEKTDSAISTNIDILGSPNVALKAVETLRLEANPRARELLVAAGPLADLRDWVMGVVAVLMPADDADQGPRSLKDWMADRLIRNTRMNANRDSRIIRV